jgi:hypothetical protein
VTFLASNSFPMREWHLEHMEKTVLKFVIGLSENASSWQKRQHRRYGTIRHCCRQVNYDKRHGVTNEEVLSFLQKIRLDSSYSSTQNDVDSIRRLDELEKQFMPNYQLIYEDLKLNRCSSTKDAY